MPTFTTHLELGGKAFAVRGGGLQFYVEAVTVGQARITRTCPQHKPSYSTDPCYIEEYMCAETGVGSGTIWRYGKNLFATEADANFAVRELEQRASKLRAERDAKQAEEAARRKEQDLNTLRRLKEQYEGSDDVAQRAAPAAT